jgi:excisionase family DNA binding protein
MQPQYVTIAEAAKFLSISVRSIRKLLSSRQLTAYRPLGGSVRIDVDELRQFAAGTARNRCTRGHHLQVEV